MISFQEYVAETLQHCKDGLIMESEMASKIIAAAEGEISFVAKPTSLYEALGIDPTAKAED
jgi:hypothetical protein